VPPHRGASPERLRQGATAVPEAAARSTASAIRRAITASRGVTAGVAHPRTQSTKWSIRGTLGADKRLYAGLDYQRSGPPYQAAKGRS